MKNRSFISFIALTVVAVIVYFAISTLYDSSYRENDYSEKLIYHPVSYKNLKSFNASKSGNKSSVQMLSNNNVQVSYSSGQFHANEFLQNREVPGVVGVKNGKKYLQPVYNIKNSAYSSSSTTTDGTSGGMLASGSASSTLPVNKLSESSLSSLSSSYSTASNGNNKNSTAAQYQPFSENNSGVPDPGGNDDDSCEDDVVFLPVPDGLPFLILLSLVYALLKLFGKKVTVKSIVKL